MRGDRRNCSRYVVQMTNPKIPNEIAFTGSGAAVNRIRATRLAIQMRLGTP